MPTAVERNRRKKFRSGYLGQVKGRGGPTHRKRRQVRAPASARSMR
ncbi:hypothetical protein HY488_03295 [Candidatus Woesearchaeota archaeon]|nr:hypothetical protein [Candidatus Woesearchaeota archaeon]